jgi:hypothetical protein
VKIFNKFKLLWASFLVLALGQVAFAVQPNLNHLPNDDERDCSTTEEFYSDEEMEVNANDPDERLLEEVHPNPEHEDLLRRASETGSSIVIPQQNHHLFANPNAVLNYLNVASSGALGVTAMSYKRH